MAFRLCTIAYAKYAGAAVEYLVTVLLPLEAGGKGRIIGWTTPN